MLIGIEGRRGAALNKPFDSIFVVIAVVGLFANREMVRAVHKEADKVSIPLHRIGVKAIAGIKVLKQRRLHLVLREVRAVMDRAGNGVGLIGLNNIDFTLRRPASIRPGLSAQHPESRPKTLPHGKAHTRLHATEGEIHFSLRSHPARGVVETGSGLIVRARLDRQLAIGNNQVIRRVVLQFVVAPAWNSLGCAVAHLDIPLGRIERRPSELIFPNELPCA